jgi:hypothetical protein
MYVCLFKLWLILNKIVRKLTMEVAASEEQASILLDF